MRTVTVDHVLKYLSGTYTDQWYSRRKGQSTIEQVMGLSPQWVDADSVTDLDNRRSHTVYVIMLKGDLCHGNRRNRKECR